MRLFGMEMKKIFSWKLLLLIAVVNVLLFYLRLEFELEHFPNGRPATDLFRIEQQLIPEYGARIDDNELLEIKALYADRVTAANAFFGKEDNAQVLGITGYKEFRAMDTADPELSAYYSDLMFESGQDFLWELQAWELLIENFEARYSAIKAQIERTDGARQQHYEQQLAEERFAFYSSTVLENFLNYKTYMAIIILISVAILMSPVFLRDYRAGMLPIQYTAKVGRGVYRAKWLAGLCSTAILTVLLLAIYMSLYWSNGTASHFATPLSSFGWYDHWYDMTFFEYILLSVASIFVVAMLLGVLSMAISTIVPNAIVLIGIQIVVLFIMIAGVTMYLIRDIIILYLPQMLVPAAYLVLFGIIFISFGWIWRRELRKDIV
ncbi:hypothetical protein QMA09_15920 [Planococcus sp. APC 3906]|nr:hypothetical protein [Planococcus sp. APC 3906]